MKELYEEFLVAKNGTHKQKAEILAKLMLQEGFEKLIDYQFNRALTCFGEHRVYFVHLRVNGEEFLKVGYTKNSVVGRFSDKRYTGGYRVEVIEIIKEELFQAKGAVEFEKKLNELIPETFRYTTELLFPGKQELISLNHKDEVLEIYNNTYMMFKDIIDTLNKSSFKSKPHKRQSQIINLIHQRVRAAYQNAKDPETKKRLKTAYDYIETVKEKSKQKGCDVAVCGHIHQPKLDIDYMNSGDFCENSTCLVEDFNGKWKIIHM